MGARTPTDRMVRHARKNFHSRLSLAVFCRLALSSTNSESPMAGRIGAVDIGSDREHRRWVDAHDGIVSLTPVGAHSAAESAGPVTALPEVPVAGDSPAPAVVVTPHHRDELAGAAAAAATAMVPRTPRHRSRRVAGSTFERVDTVVLFWDHPAAPAPGRDGVSAGRAGGAESAPPFVNPQVTPSR